MRVHIVCWCESMCELGKWECERDGRGGGGEATEYVVCMHAAAAAVVISYPNTSSICSPQSIYVCRCGPTARRCRRFVGCSRDSRRYCIAYCTVHFDLFWRKYKNSNRYDDLAVQPVYHYIQHRAKRQLVYEIDLLRFHTHWTRTFTHRQRRTWSTNKGTCLPSFRISYCVREYWVEDKSKPFDCALHSRYTRAQSFQRISMFTQLCVVIKEH